MGSQLILPVLGTLLFYLAFHVFQSLYHHVTSPLRRMVGPSSPSLYLGNFMEMADDGLVTEKWRQDFGPNFVFKGLLNVRKLHTSDIKAIAHIVSHPAVYRKDPIGISGARRFFGNGLLSAELDDHVRQRRVMNPAFGSPQIRQMSDVFTDKSSKLRDIWDAQITEDNSAPTIEVLSWLGLMALDIIGEAGFNYQLGGLDNKPTDLNHIFTQLFRSPRTPQATAFRTFQATIPLLRFLPWPGSRAFDAPRKKLFNIGEELVERSKLALNSKTIETGEAFSGRRDLLSLLLKANVAADIPEHQRMSDEEVIGQIPTFLIAGQGTTSTGSAWALHALSVNGEAQAKLRKELLTISNETPTMDELNSLVYLDWVVRETMRVYAPIVFVERMAMQDDILPLGTPYIDPSGGVHENLPIRKGEIVHIPILAVNTDKEIWGEDAAEFKPERWEHVPKATNAVPGVWANLLSFFAGPHNCIGFRFSLVEQKALLFTLIRAFEFEAAVPEGGIGRSGTQIQRPIVLGDKDKSGRLPLIVRRYHGL
ncbi:cytochrome P450 [Mycena alexandri]|uniref:Cytochrome P450 n=1 Tax=Mycena alexandri TaxID=1745969 RepID=A0AAD6T5Z3_9AGAR|nr:cytochrome P450 [Mycena alexandri]